MVQWRGFSRANFHISTRCVEEYPLITVCRKVLNGDEEGVRHAAFECTDFDALLHLPST